MVQPKHIVFPAWASNHFGYQTTWHEGISLNTSRLSLAVYTAEDVHGKLRLVKSEYQLLIHVSPQSCQVIVTHSFRLLFNKDLIRSAGIYL